MSSQPRSGSERPEKAGQQNQQNPGQRNAEQQRASEPRGQQNKNMGQQNEGEGNRTAAREYNADQHRFAGDHEKVEKAAQSARKAVDGPEGKDLARAEKEGQKHAKS
ncbi:MAG TPA: hypothetical protein VM639_10880 [Dongiaceae bacterium]|nr:hypothetical protein [Dongiaceae bacterium]